ncbi:MAG: porphobilinogen synthase [Verrucomicrobia bacterium]|nr:porphobilinogen synthase [Verrucomicrobiota bacterium]MDE3047854.1 porphobilinogen synthase [Verrucomicrobiota bacterium]
MIELNIPIRLRRNRKMEAIRRMVQETRLTPSDLVAPLFIVEGEKQRIPIGTMPGVERLSIDLAVKEAKELFAQGVHAIALFPVLDPALKHPEGKEAWNEEGLLARAIREIKFALPELCVMADVALDPFTNHGHDGLVNEKGEILNDETIECLIKMSLMQAKAGIDFVAPSDMMDGRVGAIREALDDAGFEHVGILAYSAKYASALYGPFRDALKVRLAFGDKKTYQMDPANAREALLEAALDEEEGADILMVKPATLYLDVIAKLREQTKRPIAAYHVSGEYAMVMAAHQAGYLNAEKVFYESLLSIKRAGADLIFTYAIKQVLPLLCPFQLNILNFDQRQN